MNQQNPYRIPPPKRGTHHDIIIAGAGLAGLSLAMELLRSGVLENKTLLLIDNAPKNVNDRTWCFWEKEPGAFESIVHKQWATLRFNAPGFSAPLDIAPYTYKLIRGIDLYRHCFQELEGAPGVYWLQAAVTACAMSNGTARVSAGGEVWEAGFVFSSIYEKPQPGQKTTWLLQHFKGRVIETTTDRFDPAQAVLMDLRTSQQEGTSFFYVLPFSTRRALVEYTVFSPRILEPSAYDDALDKYITDSLGIGGHRVESEEFGIIPMTDHRFPEREGNITYIGTAGGQTKASSGYTFRSVQKHSAAIAESMRSHGDPFHITATHNRFHFYDSVLLDILARGKPGGREIFTRLFKKNPAPDVLAFLDNESSPAQELSIISSLPVLPFTAAALRRLWPG